MKTKNISEQIALKFQIRGRVQGVGFRPFVYRLANELGIKGNILNRPDGIIIHCEGSQYLLHIFKEKLLSDKPHAAEIKRIEEVQTVVENIVDFTILPSENTGTIITEICPDIGVCNDCIEELKTAVRRKNYPFNNCTNCGPRFTIVKDFPYDRVRTSMNIFNLCYNCNNEFNDPYNRRFHAQPISCEECGPLYTFNKNNFSINDNYLSVTKIAHEINSGKVVAIKGLGGFNLACDAFCTEAINELRVFKQREKKPFAVMFNSLEAISEIAEVSEKEKQVLQSWQKPIVILKLKKKNNISNKITSGLPTIGVFLPYLPLHYILFNSLNTNAIILTSGNESDTPILFQDKIALETFKDISGGVLTNNREIIRRIDDSVVRVINDTTSIFRRARGYVPSPVNVEYKVDGILAVGAELSNCFCIGKDHQAIMSQHIGDLQNLETYQFYCQNIHEFSRLYRIKLHTIACDLHPDYLSTRYAEESGFNIIFTQHHHAHIASCMAEYGLKDPVIGLSYDGTGLGTDGNIWGSELLLADFNDFQRVSHFEYIPLQGGDQSVYQPWRTALSYLYYVFGKDWNKMDIPFLKSIDYEKAIKLTEAIDKKINISLGCSAGRLFDAISALLCICVDSNYHSEAPMLLENYINPEINDTYTIEGNEIISFKKMFNEIIDDIRDKVNLEIIVTKFHNTIALTAYQQVLFGGKKSNSKSVVLSGGCFQNKYLTEKLLFLLRKKEYEVYIPQLVPVNDGGIALGQLLIAANKIKKHVSGNTSKDH